MWELEVGIFSPLTSHFALPTGRILPPGILGGGEEAGSAEKNRTGRGGPGKTGFCPG